jgi:surface protein
MRFGLEESIVFELSFGMVKTSNAAPGATSSTVNFSHTVSITGNFVRSPSSNLSFSQDASFIRDFGQSASNNLSLNSEASRTVIFNRSLTDNVSFNDSATQILDIQRSLTDNLSLNSEATEEVSTTFTSVWNTAETGTSNSQQITLPLVEAGTYNFTVNWGDGNEDTVTTWNQAEVTHTYNSSGNYTIEIYGTLEGWSFNNGGDKSKISSVTNWGDLGFENATGHFYGCDNLTSNATDAPTLSVNLTNIFRDCSSLNGGVANWNTANVTDMSYMFQDASTFNQDIGSWNTVNVTDMSNMFRDASAFNQDIGSWNVTSLTDATNMFLNVNTLDTTNYSKLLIGWASQAVNEEVNFHGGSSTYNSAGATARNTLTNTYNWTITDGGAA